MARSFHNVAALVREHAFLFDADHFQARSSLQPVLTAYFDTDLTVEENKARLLHLLDPFMAGLILGYAIAYGYDTQPATLLAISADKDYDSAKLRQATQSKTTSKASLTEAIAAQLGLTI